MQGKSMQAFIWQYATHLTTQAQREVAQAQAATQGASTEAQAQALYEIARYHEACIKNMHTLAQDEAGVYIDALYEMQVYTAFIMIVRLQARALAWQAKAQAQEARLQALQREARACSIPLHRGAVYTYAQHITEAQAQAQKAQAQAREAQYYYDCLQRDAPAR